MKPPTRKATAHPEAIAQVSHWTVYSAINGSRTRVSATATGWYSRTMATTAGALSNRAMEASRLKKTPEV